MAGQTDSHRSGSQGKFSRTGSDSRSRFPFRTRLVPAYWKRNRSISWPERWPPPQLVAARGGCERTCPVDPRRQVAEACCVAAPRRRGATQPSYGQTGSQWPDRPPRHPGQTGQAHSRRVEKLCITRQATPRPVGTDGQPGSRRQRNRATTLAPRPGVPYE